VAGDSAELTGATDAAGSSMATVERTTGVGKRWRGSGRARRARERASRARGSKGTWTWPNNARSWARPRWGDRGREVEDELTGGDGGTERERERERERESGRARGKQRRQVDPTEQRGRGEERACWSLRRQAGPACQAQGARGRAWAELSGPVWAEIGFPFFRDFLIAFLFIFSRVFNSNSNQVSNSNQIKCMRQFKEYLGSI
jgi:hypothetical protein